MNTRLTVHSLHALGYCERLFFLEEVENLKVADERVYAGRTLHVEIERDEDAADETLTLKLESEIYGLVGKVNCIRRRGGEWFTNGCTATAGGFNIRYSDAG